MRYCNVQKAEIKSYLKATSLVSFFLRSVRLLMALIIQVAITDNDVVINAPVLCDRSIIRSDSATGDASLAMTNPASRQ